jgi:hypothetical protein
MTPAKLKGLPPPVPPPPPPAKLKTPPTPKRKAQAPPPAPSPADTDVADKLLNLGKLGYPPVKCANVLQLTGRSRDQFIKDMTDPDSEAAKTWQMGQDLADFEIDTKLYMLARSGDIKSLHALEYRKQSHNAKNP